MRKAKHTTKDNNSAYRVLSLYFDGNAARDLEPGPAEKKPLTGEELEKRRRKARERAKRARAVERQRALIRTTVMMLGVSVVLLLIVAVLNSSAKTTEIMMEISDLEHSYNVLASQNASKEYDINRSVDYSTIISKAESYGMQRGTGDQVITYKADDSEYIQVFASVSSD